MVPKLLIAAVAAAACASVCMAGGAAQFRFGDNANGLSGQASATLSDGGVSLTIQPGLTGSLLSEGDRGGMGVDSRRVAGVVSEEREKFNLLAGDPAIDALGEHVTLLFDRAGVISAIDFDGVKDEALEYFVLTTSSGLRINFFDSAANTTVSGAVDSAITGGVVTGDVVYLLEDSVFDDEAVALSIPFSANEPLTLLYAELGAGFNPTEQGNGARFQGIVVSLVPEPGLCGFAAVACMTVLAGKRRVQHVGRVG